MINHEKIISLKEKICNLKAKLSATDYKAIKFAEGEITATEYAPVLAERRKWRAEINALETELAMYNGG